MESLFYLTLPPCINDKINKDNKTLSCGSFITVSGNNLLTNDEEFKVKVLANKQDTEIIKNDENILIVICDSNGSPLNVSVFIVIPNFKNNQHGISIIIGGISLSNIINAILTLSSSGKENNIKIPLTCDLQFSNEIDITNNTDRLSCYSNSTTNETSGVLNFQFASVQYVFVN
ncbi:hypothetical protein ACTFIY_008650 [Dictyostelium cf. discoideum]